LAIIAYKQPIIRSDIEHIRGVDSGGVLRVLMEKKLVRVLGRREIPGRPLIYATTKHFLEVFDLKNLKDLPTPKEIEELTAQESDLENPTEVAPPAFEAPSATQVPVQTDQGGTDEAADRPMENSGADAVSHPQTEALQSAEASAHQGDPVSLEEARPTPELVPEDLHAGVDNADVSEVSADEALDTDEDPLGGDAPE
jgi:segregation and condensation protein B